MGILRRLGRNWWGCSSLKVIDQGRARDKGVLSAPEQIEPCERETNPGGAKNRARGIDMIDKGTDRIPRRWSRLKALKWKDSLRESVVDPSKALAAKAVNARVVLEDKR